jgi:hypothetical protein
VVVEWLLGLSGLVAAGQLGVMLPGEQQPERLLICDQGNDQDS